LIVTHYIIASLPQSFCTRAPSAPHPASGWSLSPRSCRSTRLDSVTRLGRASLRGRGC